jgi:hypothetical protein
MFFTIRSERKKSVDDVQLPDAMNPFIEFDCFATRYYLRFSTVYEPRSENTAGEGLMDLKCANPICNSTYEYGHGRLLRIQQTPAQEKQPSHWHGVKHYWLCTRCKEKFTIEFQKGTGVLLTEKLEEGAETQPTFTLLQSESATNQDAKPLLPRLTRSRARHRKQAGESAPAGASAAEVVEIRKTERRG